MSIIYVTSIFQHCEQNVEYNFTFFYNTRQNEQQRQSKRLFGIFLKRPTFQSPKEINEIVSIAQARIEIT